MLDNSDDKIVKASHNKIEDAIREHLITMEIDGLVTGWLLGVTIANMEDGTSYEGLYSTQSDGLGKWTTIGIASTMLDAAKDLGLEEDD